MSPGPDTGAALEVRDLCVRARRSGAVVVDGVSFDVPAGTVMGLVGESGSGKSTVGLALLGYARRGLQITGGSVRLGDTDVLDLPDPALRQTRGRVMSFVPQDPASGLNPALRLGTQLREALSVHPGVLDTDETIAERVQKLLGEVGLPGTRAFLRSYPHQVSGGQQQRIGIAMAFACRPRLVVLDEPTTGLDVTTQRRVLDTVAELTESHRTTAVYVSHDLPVVASIASTTAVMYAGRIIEHALTAALFSHPMHPYTDGLLQAAPTPDRATTLVGMAGRPPRPGARPPGCTFADRCPSAADDCRPAEPPLSSHSRDHPVRCFHPLESTKSAVGQRVTPLQPHPGAAGLAVERLVARYGSRDVLRGVDFSLAPGSCMAVVGESGSGKTTLARCLAGLHADWHGAADLNGQALAPSARRRTDAQRRAVQYVFQNPFASLNPRMSVAENVEEPLRHFDRLGRRERRAKVLDTLDVVALGAEFADRMPGQLSGGERQRVAVGRALIVEPTLLICDEITSALDVSVQALLIEQLRSLQRERGLTALFITHNLAVVRSIAQEVIVLDEGVIVERGTSEKVLTAPEHPYTRQLVADLPRLSAAAS